MLPVQPHRCSSCKTSLPLLVEAARRPGPVGVHVDALERMRVNRAFAERIAQRAHQALERGMVRAAPQLARDLGRPYAANIAIKTWLARTQTGRTSTPCSRASRTSWAGA